MAEEDTLLIEPSGANFIAAKEITDLQRFVELCTEALGYPQLSLLIDELGGPHVKDESYHATRIERRDRLKKLEEYTTFQSQNGFPHLYGLATVRLWTILEVFVQDLLVWIISNVPEVRDFPIINKLKGPLLEFASASQQKQSEYILDLLYNELSASLRRGVGKFEHVLNAIELGGSIDERVKKNIFELSEIRNIVAHRNGIADERFVTNCPWQNVNAGEPIPIYPPQFTNYCMSASWYIVEISRRHLVRYPPKDQKLYVTQEYFVDLQKKMSEVIEQKLTTDPKGSTDSPQDSTC